ERGRRLGIANRQQMGLGLGDSLGAAVVELASPLADLLKPVDVDGRLLLLPFAERRILPGAILAVVEDHSPLSHHLVAGEPPIADALIAQAAAHFFVVWLERGDAR